MERKEWNCWWTCVGVDKIRNFEKTPQISRIMQIRMKLKFWNAIMNDAISFWKVVSTKFGPLWIWENVKLLPKFGHVLFRIDLSFETFMNVFEFKMLRDFWNVAFWIILLKRFGAKDKMFIYLGQWMMWRGQ